MKIFLKFLCYIHIRIWLTICSLFLKAMLTRHEVLMELKRMGVKEPSLLKSYLRDFEDYMSTHYGLKIVKRKKRSNELPKDKSPSSP